MRVTVRRLVSVAACAGALSALALTTAQAQSAPTATTGGASGVTSSTATVSGQIDTAGQPVTYEFEYGPTTGYGSHTPLRSIAAGMTSVQNVSETITGLAPGTTYHYQLAVAPQAGTGYGTVVLGGDATFTTSAAPHTGSLQLGSKRLIVKRGKVTVPLNCASGQSCRGKLKIARGFAICVGGKSFFISAGGSTRAKAKVSGACRRLLRHAKRHRIGAQLTTSMSSGQPNLSKNVKLVRG